MTLRKDGSGGAELENFPKVDEVVANRNGDVLIKNTLLKADHFPGKSRLYIVYMHFHEQAGIDSSMRAVLPWSYLPVGK